MDDNDAILLFAGAWYHNNDAIKARLAIGLERYGHGVRVNDDTTQWGTEKNSWLEMGLEEIDDLAIYVTAELLRRSNGRPLVKRKDFPERSEFFSVLADMSIIRDRIVLLMDDA